MTDGSQRWDWMEEDGPCVRRGVGAAWIAACFETDMQTRPSQSAGRSGAKCAIQSPERPDSAAAISRDAR